LEEEAMKQTLEDHLSHWAAHDPAREAIATTVLACAQAGRKLAELCALGPLAGDLAAGLDASPSGDAQKELDRRAHDLFVAALRHAPVAVLGSEEAEAPLVLRADGHLAVAIDPLDGSSNIAVNAPLGSIFSILPIDPALPPAQQWLRPGSAQLAAGFLIYGPETALVLSLGSGTDIFTLHRPSGAFLLTRAGLSLPRGTNEYAINASNYRHWEPPIRAYIDDCLAGAEGPRRADFNTRWLASVVAEAYRILLRGGIYLYPGDARPGYREGRLRLVYEAAPLAFLIEQAGGAASDGVAPILSRTPTSLHQRTPLIFGADDKVARVRAYYAGELAIAERAPLFGRRGLFRTDRELAPCR
jgi:fructose-1,6-bisphosphatase I